MSDWLAPLAEGGESSVDSAGFDAPNSPVRLRRVALPLDGSERFQWRLAAVLLALSACRGRSASVDQLHTLVWAINDPANAEILQRAWDGQTPPRRARGYVTTLLQTLRVAQTEGLVEQALSGRQKLTPRGVAFVKSMREDGVSLGSGDELLLRLSPISSADMTRKLGGQPK
jgi:hypothetical protein